MAYSGNSIVDYLKSVGQDSSFGSRTTLAKQYGISGYGGTAAQNTQLLSSLRSGGQISPAAPPPTEPTPPPVPYQKPEQPAYQAPTPTGQPIYQAPTPTGQPISSDASNLYQYYTEQGKNLPSVSKRAGLYQKAGLGSASSYVGSSSQNNALLESLKGGTGASAPTNQLAYQAPTPTGQPIAADSNAAGDSTASLYTGNSIVDYLKSTGQASDISSRIALGKKYGIDYSGSTTGYATENTELLRILRSGQAATAGTPADVTPTNVPPPDVTPLPEDLDGGDDIAATSEGVETEEEIDADKEIEDEINYYTKIQTLNQLKKDLGLGEKPATPSMEEAYKVLQSQYGTDAISSQLNDLNSLIADKEAALRQGLYNQEGRLAPMELIGTRQRELSRQGQEELDTLTREKNALVGEYNTKMGIISNLVELKGVDYDNAKEAYDSAFTQAIQLQGFLMDSQNMQEDNARANLTVLANLMEGSTGTIPASLSAQMKQLELQSGLPVGVTEYFLSSQAADTKVMSTGKSNDANGDEFVYFITKNPETGIPETSKVYTGGVSSSSSTGEKTSTYKFNTDERAELLGKDMTNEEINAVQEALNTTSLKDIATNLGLDEVQEALIRRFFGDVDVEKEIVKALIAARKDGMDQDDIPALLAEFGLKDEDDWRKYITHNFLGSGWEIRKEFLVEAK